MAVSKFYFSGVSGKKNKKILVSYVGFLLCYFIAVLFIPRRGYFLDYTTFTCSEFVFTYGPFMLIFFRHLFKVTSGGIPVRLKNLFE